MSLSSLLLICFFGVGLGSFFLKIKVNNNLLNNYKIKILYKKSLKVIFWGNVYF